MAETIFHVVLDLLAMGAQSRLSIDAVANLQQIRPPPTGRHAHHRSWASPSPPCLRAQLLFLLREPKCPVTFRDWRNENSAPGGTLPTLHIVSEDRLIPTDEIRGWLDETHPIMGERKEQVARARHQVDACRLHGMPDQASFDRALAFAQLVLGRLYPAYLAALPDPPADLHLSFPTPPPLAAGLTTPLPESLTGDSRLLNLEDVTRKGREALEALSTILEYDEWALGAA